MSFVFPILLSGLALLAVPVLIHLIRRQKPRTLPFPAFRFLLQRHRTNLRKLRLRHWLLLTLRLLVLAAICLALARPRLFSEPFGLSADRPVAAVLLFDTSYSMDYRTSDGVSRWEEAKKRGLELLDQLPEGSRVAILDSGEAAATGPGAWLASLNQARDRIARLRLRAANAPITTRLENAYRLLAEMAGDNRSLPRLLAVFSDRTRACWDAGQVAKLLDAADQVPPPLERLQRLRGTVPTLLDLLGRLRQEMPPTAGQDYAEQEMIALWRRLADLIPSLNSDNYPDRNSAELLAKLRGKTRALLGLLRQQKGSAEGYKEKLTTVLASRLEELRGVQAIFVDVGVDDPVNLGIVALELPDEGSGSESRQVFAPDEKIVLRAVVEATGKDFDSTLLCRVGGKTMTRPVRVKAGGRAVVPFEIDMQDLAPGPHQVEVRLAAPDQLAFDNTRYLTFAVRQPRKGLIITDDPAKADPWRRAIEARKEVRFRCTILSSRAAVEVGPGELAQYQAVYLLSVARPTAGLWAALREYGGRGGGVGIIPGGSEMDLADYNGPAAQQVLPGKLTRIVVQKEPGPAWAWDDPQLYQHPMLRVVRQWRDLGRDDFIKLPRTATRYWETEPGKEGAIVARYADDKKQPALLERRLGSKGCGGRILLFTTRLDAGQKPRWNNYMESATSFCVVLPGLATSYLAGDAEAAQLNYISGQGTPTVKLPLTGRAPAYAVQGPNVLETIPAGEEQNVLAIKEATDPGNYTVEDPGRNRIGAFSINLPAEESILARVPSHDIEALFGPGAVAPLGERARLSAVLQGHWDQPLDLMPALLLALLLFLALETLLGNLFYRKGPEMERAK
jgi:hypothetical protein